MDNIHIDSGLLGKCGEIIKGYHEPCRVALVTDYTVGALYVTTVADSLKSAGFEVFIFAFEGGEQSKNLETYGKILEFFADNEITRSDLAVALGGGVVGDLTGFAAATYMRGINYVQMPTTLLSMVDSSIGGKTSIDLDAGKNLCGAFHQPLCIISSVDTLETLDKKYYNDGVAEIIKYAMLGNDRIIQSLENGIDCEIIKEAVKTKLSFVEGDEFDRGRRRMLNFGHTTGHAVEHASRYAIPHGHAVAIGMCAMARAGEKLGITKEGTSSELERLVSGFGLPTTTIISPDDLLNSALSDKKRSGDSIDLVFPISFGKCEIKTFPVEKLGEIISLGVK